jgi:hypothetical protein
MTRPTIPLDVIVCRRELRAKKHPQPNAPFETKVCMNQLTKDEMNIKSIAIVILASPLCVSGQGRQSAAKCQSLPLVGKIMPATTSGCEYDSILIVNADLKSSCSGDGNCRSRILFNVAQW